MKSPLIWAVAAVAALAVTGCDRQSETKISTPKTTDLGTGLNKVERTYAKPAHELVDAVTASLRSYDLTVESDTHDDLGGEIVARRADGHRVTAKITALDQTNSQISVRVAPGNKNLAEMIHTRIAEKVSGLDAK